MGPLRQAFSLNQTGRSASGKRTSPRMPVSMKTNRNAWGSGFGHPRSARSTRFPRGALSHPLVRKSTPGEIQITRTTYELLKDEFVCRRRGTILVKGIGSPVARLCSSAATARPRWGSSWASTRARSSAGRATFRPRQSTPSGPWPTGLSSYASTAVQVDDGPHRESFSL
jgi:hypothetical protein